MKISPVLFVLIVCLLSIQTSATLASQSSPSLSSTRSSKSHSKPTSHKKTYSWSLRSQATPIFTAPRNFPKDEFPGMYYLPKDQDAEPRPIVTDINHKKFPDSLNNPSQMPTDIHQEKSNLPKAKAHVPSHPHQFVEKVLKNASEIIESKKSWCTKCKALLPLGQRLAHNVPKAVPEVLIKLCKKYNYSRYGKNPDNNKTCEQSYVASGQGGIFAQVLAYADFSKESTDSDQICSQMFFGACGIPEPSALSSTFLDHWFNGKREASRKVKTRSKKVEEKAKKPLKVLWTSDIHLQGRYAVGSEADCSFGFCCNSNSFNMTTYNISGYPKSRIPARNISTPAPYWGYEGCDAPWSLVASAFQTISALGGYDLALYTGDLVTHAQTWEESEDLVKYSESALYDMMKRHVGNTTVIAAIGNHDSSPTEMAAPASLPDGRSNQFSWDWNYMSKLWESEHWINSSTAKNVRSHYGGYSITPRKGLRVITFNTDFWYNGNAFAFINTTNPDVSGVLRFVTDELQAAELKNERVWIVGHVLPGWDGYSSLDNPTNLFYQIVTRYSHTIAAMFFGHTHEDQFSVFYHNTNGNSSSISKKTEDAIAISYISPSITPYKNMNPGIRVLEIDPETYEVMDYHQYYTPLESMKHRNHTNSGLVWYKLYSAREAYSDFKATMRSSHYHHTVKLNGTKWPSSAPLNATFWSMVADEVELRPELAAQFNLYQGRNSPLSPKCNTQECATAKSCFMRSGSWALGRKCDNRYATVQRN